MGWFGTSDDYDKVNQAQHSGHITHDLLSGAAAYKAMQLYESKYNKDDPNARTKEAIAAVVGAAMTHLVETKGRDLWDKHQEEAAQKKAREALEERLLSEGY